MLTSIKSLLLWGLEWLWPCVVVFRSGEGFQRYQLRWQQWWWWEQGGFGGRIDKIQLITPRMRGTLYLPAWALLVAWCHSWRATTWVQTWVEDISSALLMWLRCWWSCHLHRHMCEALGFRENRTRVVDLDAQLACIDRAIICLITEISGFEDSKREACWSWRSRYGGGQRRIRKNQQCWMLLRGQVHQRLGIAP